MDVFPTHNGRYYWRPTETSHGSHVYTDPTLYTDLHASDFSSDIKCFHFINQMDVMCVCVPNLLILQSV